MKFIPKNLRRPIIDKEDKLFKFNIYLQPIGLLLALSIFEPQNSAIIEQLEIREEIGATLSSFEEESTEENLEDNTEENWEERLETLAIEEINKSVEALSEDEEISPEAQKKLDDENKRAKKEKVEILNILNKDKKYQALKKEIMELENGIEIDNSKHLELQNKFLELRAKARAKIQKKSFYKTKRRFNKLKKEILKKLKEINTIEEKLKILTRELSNKYPYVLTNSDPYELEGNCESIMHLIQTILREDIKKNNPNEKLIIGYQSSINEGTTHVSATVQTENKIYRIEHNQFSEIPNDPSKTVTGTSSLKALIGISPNNKGINQTPKNKTQTNSISAFGGPQVKIGKNRITDLSKYLEPTKINLPDSIDIQSFNKLSPKLKEKLLIGLNTLGPIKFANKLKRIITKRNRHGLESKKYLNSNLAKFMTEFQQKTQPYVNTHNKVLVTPSSESDLNELEKDPNIIINLQNPKRLKAGITYNATELAKSTDYDENNQNLETLTYDDYCIIKLDLTKPKTLEYLDRIPKDKKIILQSELDNDELKKYPNIYQYIMVMENQNEGTKRAIDIRNFTKFDYESFNYNQDPESIILYSENTHPEYIKRFKQYSPNTELIKLP